MASVSVLLTAWMALVVIMMGLTLWLLVRIWRVSASSTPSRDVPLMAFEPPWTHDAGMIPPPPRIPDASARTFTSTGFVTIIPELPTQQTLGPNITNGNGEGRSPSDNGEGRNPFIAPDAPPHDCSIYGSLPVGYGRVTRSGLVFHDPQRCQRWSSDETESFDLSEASLELDANCVVNEEALA